jgi:uncharacterized membrane protein
VIRTTVLQGMAITVPLGIPIFVVFALAMGGFAALAEWGAASWLWMVLAGIVHFVIGRYGNYRATQALGATLSTPIQQLSILVALVLAFAFLGETVNAVNVIGILLIVFGPMVVARRRGKNAEAARRKGFEADYRAGFLWGLVCALGYGSSPLFIALGLGATGTMADSAAGVLVSYVAASLVVAVLVAVAGGRGYLAGIDRGSAFWFLASAALVAFSQLFRYLALAVAPVSVVMPIQRLSVVFRILFNGWINRDHEVLDAWVIASILVAVLGAALLSLDTRFLLGLVGLPETHWLAAPLV